MKAFMVLLICFGLNTAWAKEDYGALFARSEILKSTIQKIETNHRVTCSVGRTSGLLSGIIKKVTYVAFCERPGIQYKVKVSGSFKNKKNPVFRVNRFKVSVKKGLGLEDADEDMVLVDKSSDPFLEAYKKSSLVESIRNFVEDNYQVTCRPGRAMRGKLWGKANYFYRVTCKNDKRKIKLIVKSKVYIVGEEIFRFKLTNYKVKIKK